MFQKLIIIMVDGGVCFDHLLQVFFFWKHLLGLVLNSCYIIIEKKKWLLMFVYVLIWGKMIDFFSCQSLLCYLWRRSDWYWKNIKDDGEFFFPGFLQITIFVVVIWGSWQKKKSQLSIEIELLSVLLGI